LSNVLTRFFSWGGHNSKKKKTFSFSGEIVSCSHSLFPRLPPMFSFSPTETIGVLGNKGPKRGAPFLYSPFPFPQLGFKTKKNKKKPLCFGFLVGGTSSVEFGGRDLPFFFSLGPVFLNLSNFPTPPPQFPCPGG